jgi:hypothetical protein
MDMRGPRQVSAAIEKIGSKSVMVGQQGNTCDAIVSSGSVESANIYQSNILSQEEWKNLVPGVD